MSSTSLQGHTRVLRINQEESGLQLKQPLPINTFHDPPTISIFNLRVLLDGTCSLLEGSCRVPVPGRSFQSRRPLVSRLRLLESELENDELAQYILDLFKAKARGWDGCKSQQGCCVVSLYHTYVRTYVRTYLRTYVRMYVCMYVFMYVCVCLHTYADFTHKHIPQTCKSIDR